MERFLFVLFTLAGLCLPLISGTTDFYCAEDGKTQVINNKNGTIRTLYPGETYYGNNRYCAWKIVADDDPNTRIQITVTLSDLDWAPESAICSGYDHVNVYDGDSPDADLLVVSWCSHQNPRSIITSNTTIFIIFQTNDRNTYKKRGVVLDFQQFTLSPDPGACPQGWTEGNNGKDCYYLRSHIETYHSGQRYCGYDHSNLVTFTTDKEAEFVKNEIVSGTTGSVWIGINDILENGHYQWLGNIDSSATHRWTDQPHTPDPFLFCVAMDTNSGLWKEQFCTEGEVQTLVKYPFVCKRKKAENTALFAIPKESTGGGDLGTKQPIVWFIVGPLLGILFLITISVLVVVYWKKLRQKKQNKGESYAEYNRPSSNSSEYRHRGNNLSSHSNPPRQNHSSRNISSRSEPPRSNIRSSANVNYPQRAGQTPSSVPTNVNVNVHVNVNTQSNNDGGISSEAPPPYSAGL